MAIWPYTSHSAVHTQTQKESEAKHTIFDAGSFAATINVHLKY